MLPNNILLEAAYVASQHQYVDAYSAAYPQTRSLEANIPAIFSSSQIPIPMAVV
jgi:hypothetical protein